MMLSDFPLFPEQASTTAPQVDYLYWFLTVVCGAVPDAPPRVGCWE